MRFSDRKRQHDRALELFDQTVREFGFKSEPWGQEDGNPRLLDLWRILPDEFSAMCRWRPDRCLLNPYATTLAEVKSEAGTHNSFAIEAASFLAGIHWARRSKEQIYAFVDLSDGSIRCCRHSDIPKRQRILAPPHPRRDEIGMWIERDWPSAEYVRYDRQTNGGANTAFFTIPKNSIFLLPIDRFFGEKMRTTD